MRRFFHLSYRECFGVTRDLKLYGAFARILGFPLPDTYNRMACVGRGRDSMRIYYDDGTQWIFGAPHLSRRDITALRPPAAWN